MHRFLVLIQIAFVGRSEVAAHYYALERLIPRVLPDMFLQI